jgi:hypothetical protein
MAELNDKPAKGREALECLNQLRFSVRGSRFANEKAVPTFFGSQENQ